MGNGRSWCIIQIKAHLQDKSHINYTNSWEAKTETVLEKSTHSKIKQVATQMSLNGLIIIIIIIINVTPSYSKDQAGFSSAGSKGAYHQA